MSGNELIELEEIQNRIYTIRGLQVMIDRDLASLYDVETRTINQAVKRNSERFIIIDHTTVYHFGASLKDLGKKWFAFSKMDIGAIEMLARLEGMK
jgi:ORF6N domain